MKYKCLILDHDDTTVNSTAEVNYPALLDTLSHLRPGIRPDYEEFMDYLISGIPESKSALIDKNKKALAFFK